MTKIEEVTITNMCMVYDDNKESCNTLLSAGFTYDPGNKLYILKELIS